MSPPAAAPPLNPPPEVLPVRFKRSVLSVPNGEVAPDVCEVVAPRGATTTVGTAVWRNRLLLGKDGIAMTGALPDAEEGMLTDFVGVNCTVERIDWTELLPNSDSNHVFCRTGLADGFPSAIINGTLPKRNKPMIAKRMSFNIMFFIFISLLPFFI
jgi:hypothetical protein